mmetsp:Transcript_16311/g.27844  ORF Transcript_16311/g.27844 Transcript_16311/m.27844 type:complete len:594 (-) Transcript_16311:38-1819(-)
MARTHRSDRVNRAYNIYHYPRTAIKAMGNYSKKTKAISADRELVEAGTMSEKEQQANMGRSIADADSGGGGSARPIMKRTGGKINLDLPSQEAREGVAVNVDEAQRISDSGSGSSSILYPLPSIYNTQAAVNSRQSDLFRNQENYYMRTATDSRQGALFRSQESYSMRTTIDSRQSALFRATLSSRQTAFDRERVRGRLHEMQRHLDRASIDATNSEHNEQLEEEQEIVSLVSSLRETNKQHENVIQLLQEQLSDMESQHRSAKAEVRAMKRKHIRSKSQYNDLIEKMATKALEQLQSHDDSVKAEAQDWKGKYDKIQCLHDELVERVAKLAEENGQLVTQNERLEEEFERHKEDLAVLEDLQEENDALHESMEEAMDLAEAMNQKMANFVQVHNYTVREYEETLGKLANTNELNRERSNDDGRSTAFRALEEENELLRAQFKEAESYFSQDNLKLKEVNAEKEALREESDALRAKLDKAKEVEEGYKQELIEFDAENDAIYRTCVGLRKEIDLLQRNALVDPKSTQDDKRKRSLSSSSHSSSQSSSHSSLHHSSSHSSSSSLSNSHSSDGSYGSRIGKRWHDTLKNFGMNSP